MADIKSLNGYMLKDETARDQIISLQESFDSHNHDSSYELKTDASAKLEEAKSYADDIKNDLLNGAGEAYDTLKELGELIDENHSAIEVLEDVATNKADKEHTHSWNELDDKPFYGENNVVEWDGIPDGRLAITISNGTVTTENVSSAVFLSKVSDIVISPEEAIGGVLTLRATASAEYGYLYGETSTLVIEDGMFSINNETMWMYADGHLVCVFEPVNGVETGLYFIRIEGGGFCVTSFKWGDLKQLDEKYIPDTIARVSDIPEQVNADWNDNDESSPAYINNRTHWDDSSEITLVENATIDFSSANGFIEISPTFEIVAGETYVIVWDGVEYKCECSELGGGLYTIGNRSYQEWGDDTEEPFLIACENGGASMAFGKGLDTHTITVIHVSGSVHQLDEKYLPDTVMMKSEFNEEAALVLLYETGIIEPATDYDGMILTDEDGNVLSY